MVGRDGQRDMHLERMRRGGIAVDIADMAIAAGRQELQSGPHPPLAGVEDVVDRVLDGRRPIFRREGAQSPFGHPADAKDGVEVGLRLRGRAHIVEDEPKQFRPPALVKAHVVEPQPLLQNVGRRAIEGARRHAADVAPMRTDHYMEDRRGVSIDGPDYSDIVEVGAAGIGVVVQQNVVGADRAVDRERALHRSGHRNDVEGVSSPDSATRRPLPSISTQEKS